MTGDRNLKVLGFYELENLMNQLLKGCRSILPLDRHQKGEEEERTASLADLPCLILCTAALGTMQRRMLAHLCIAIAYRGETVIKFLSHKKKRGIENRGDESFRSDNRAFSTLLASSWLVDRAA